MHSQLNRSKGITMTWVATIGLLALAGCAGPASTAPGALPATAAASDLPTSVATLAPAGSTPAANVAPTAQVSSATSSPAGTPVMAATSMPAPTAAGQDRVITLNDDGKSIALHQGERFSLQLGEDLEWTVTSSDPAVVSRVVNILPVRGSQGVYETRAPGQATISASGDAACRKARPPCMVPTRAFQIQVIVQ